MGVALSGCASNQQWVDRNDWANPSGWFGNLDHDGKSSQTSPDISHIHGPLTPPVAAPRAQVQATPLATPPALPVPPAKTKVAILLPLTGRDASLGQAMLNAAQQAVFDAGDDRFELMPRDTGAGEASAETAARDAIGSGAQLLIGPLFAANIPAVKAVVQNSSVNMLTLSTDTTMAGPNVFVMGFTPGPQVERIVNYAMAHGLRHFAALIPNNAYGALVGPIFRSAVAHDGGVIAAVETYDPAKQDSDAHIHALALYRDQIDALFLPEGGGDLTLIAGQLARAGFDSHRIRLLGTGLWDAEGLGRRSNFLVSGWYAASDPAGRRNFIKAYVATYGQEPPRLATLAYDATALAAVLSKRNGTFDAKDLTNPNGFAGLDGIFRLTAAGVVERGLAINEILPDGTRVIDPAPATFAVY